MDVLIDAVITVLQVLSFRNAVSANQDIDVVIFILGIKEISVFGNG